MITGWGPDTAAGTVPVLLTFLCCFSEVVADHDFKEVMPHSGKMGLMWHSNRSEIPQSVYLRFLLSDALKN